MAESFLQCMRRRPALLALLLQLLAVCVVLLLDGLNKSTLVSCPMLMYAGLVVYGREHFALPFSVWASCGMVLLGLLLLAARSSAVPERSRRRPD